MTPIHKRAAGFTLIELLVSITDFAIPLAIGATSSNNLTRNQKISTQASSVVGALNYARGEVASRSMPVTVCAASTADRTECGDTTNWEFGWIIFTDRSGDPGIIDGTDE